MIPFFASSTVPIFHFIHSWNKMWHGVRVVFVYRPGRTSRRSRRRLQGTNVQGSGRTPGGRDICRTPSCAKIRGETPPTPYFNPFTNTALPILLQWPYVCLFYQFTRLVFVIVYHFLKTTEIGNVNAFNTLNLKRGTEQRTQNATLPSLFSKTERLHFGKSVTISWTNSSLFIKEQWQPCSGGSERLINCLRSVY